MPAQILSFSLENLQIAAEALRRGEVVAMPTETVYGLAGNALNPLALTRIFETKERPTFDPLIVHVGISCKRIEDLDRIGLVSQGQLKPEAQQLANFLMSRFWPGPLTLILPKQELVPDLATSGLPSVGVRIPRHPVAQALIAAAGVPLAAPSANRFGRISPTSAHDVFEELGDRIDFILDGGPCEVGVESTILSISEGGALTLLRPGGLPLEEIEKITGTPVLRPETHRSSSSQALLAPGMLESHYAPRKPLILLPSPLSSLPASWEPPKELQRQSVGLLSLSLTPNQASELFKTKTGLNPTLCYSLSAQGDLNEAAKNLFQKLRSLDQSPVSMIFAEPCLDQTGLGFAIGDRLRRAAAPRKMASEESS